MADFALDAGFALFLWWFSTGLVLFLNQRPARTFRVSLSIATIILFLALFGVVWSKSQTTVLGAYVSFSCGVLIYAWQELSYYMGFITGPRKVACHHGCSGWRHFGHALQVNLYHEAAIIAVAALLVTLSWGASNQLGMWVYMLLWFMQLSAKLNVFLGVRNLSEEFLPSHMQHLKSFLKQRPMNLLFPISVTVGTVMTTWLFWQALATDSGSFAATGWTFLATLMALAVLEHWFLVLPMPASSLWQCWLEQRESRSKRRSANSIEQKALSGASP